MNHLFTNVHPSWQPLLEKALSHMDKMYLSSLTLSKNTYLPNVTQLFNAFSLPFDSMSYILLGESPYPRQESANGYAFWDGNVTHIWEDTGLSKRVNRATSLRNFIKMLLFARGDLEDDFSQTAISKIDKTNFVKKGSDFFKQFMRHGFLLLNASLVYEKGRVNYHAKHWRPFIEHLFRCIYDKNPFIKIILLGKIAQNVPNTNLFSTFVAEHPYNVSFITNQSVVEFFKPFDLLVSNEFINHQ